MSFLPLYALLAVSQSLLSLRLAWPELSLLLKTSDSCQSACIDSLNSAEHGGS